MSNGVKSFRLTAAALKVGMLASLLTWGADLRAAPDSVDPVPPDVIGLCHRILSDEAKITKLSDEAKSKGKQELDLKAALDGASCLERRPAVIQFCNDPVNEEPVSGIDLLATQAALEDVQRQYNQYNQMIVERDAATKALAKAQANTEVFSKLSEIVVEKTDALGRSTPQVRCASPDGMKIAGGIDAVALQDTVIRGLAAFVSARLKGELSLALEKQLFTDLCGDREAATLFEASCTLLKGRAKQDTQRIQAWGTLKAAFEADLQELPTRIVVLVFSNKRVGAAVGPTARELAKLAVAVLEAAAKGQDIVQVLKAKTVAPTQSCDSMSLECYQFMIGSAVQALSSELGNEFPAPGAFDAYARVVLKEMMIAGGKHVGNLLHEGKLRVRIEALRQLRAQLELLAAVSKNTDRGPERVSAYLTSIAPLFKQAAVLWQGENLPSDTASGTATEPPCAKMTPSCLVWIGDRIERATELFDDVRARNYQAAWVDALALAQDFGVYDKLPKWVSAYGSFAVQLAAAKTSEEAQAALEAAALPLGSYENKRTAGNFAMTVTALPGLRYGREWVQRSDVEAEPSSAAHTGMFAPVGVDMTWGIADKWSLGVMVSVIDLGNLVDYRLEEKDDVPTTDASETVDVDTEPKVGFAQIVSPGAYLTLGIYDLPLVIGGGVSLAPGLRTLESSNGEKSDGTVLQASAFLAVDVSIFPIVN